MFIRFFIILILINLSVNGFSLNNPYQQNDFTKAEDSLSLLLKSIISNQSVTQKIELNQEFENLFYKTLMLNGSFDYPFDSLKNIGKLRSPDGNLRVITWNLPVTAGEHRYFGFIQIKTDGEIKLYKLADSRLNIGNPQAEICTPQKWYGALYYYISENSFNNVTYYTLLGVDFNNLFSSRRVIEVLWLNSDDEPVFGALIFRINDQTISRVIFEYSARVSMMLRYSDDHQMLVFDHLSPSRPDLAGNYQFYGPDFSYDGFKFAYGYWNYLPDIDLRNPVNNSTITPIKAPEENREPGFLYRSNLELRNSEQ